MNSKHVDRWEELRKVNQNLAMEYLRIYTTMDIAQKHFNNFKKECCEIAKDWLKQPYKKLTYKLNKFEFDLIQTYRDCHESCKLSEFKQLIELKDKGYFKDINLDLTIHEILDNCEVV